MIKFLSKHIIYRLKEMSRYSSMSKKVDLNKLSPQELLAYAQNLVKQSEKVKQPHYRNAPIEKRRP